MTPNTVSFQKVEEGKAGYRAIVWEYDEDTGAKSIADIAEINGTLDECRPLSWWFDWVEGIEIDSIHEGVDFGRATKHSSKCWKIMQSL